MASGRKVTLAAATATKIADGGPGYRPCKIRTALTDLVIGGSDITATVGYVTAAAWAHPGVDVNVGVQDLYAFSTTGGDIYIFDPDR